MLSLKDLSMSRSIAWALLIVVLLVGAGLRISALNTYPPAVSNDESLDVIDAFHIARTGIYPFYEDLGRPEPLYPLTLAAATALFGPGVFTARLATEFIGVVTLAALYWCATECFYDLSPTLRRLTALLAVIVLATAIGHITLSRALYRGIWQPLGMLLCMGWALRALRLNSWRAAALSGVFLSLTLYSYTAAYVFPGVFVALGLWLFVFRGPIRWRSQTAEKPKLDASTAIYPSVWRRWLPILLIIAGVSVVLMLPVGVRFLQARQAVLGRASAVSGGWGLESMVRLVPFLFFGQGDQNPQYNAARSPLIALVLQPLFVLGLLALLLRLRGPSTPIILAALALGTLPVLLSQEVPHGLRIAGEYAVFPLVIGAAGALILVGINYLAARTRQALSLQYSPVLVWGAVGVMGVMLVWQAGTSWAAYRGYWEHAEQYRLWEIYGEKLTHNEWFYRVDRRRFAEWLITQNDPILLPLEEMQQLVTRTYLMRHYDDFATADNDFVLPENTRLVVPWTLETHDILRETRHYVLLHEGRIIFLPDLTSESQAELLQNIDDTEEIYRDDGVLGFGGRTHLIDNWQPTYEPEHALDAKNQAVLYGNDLKIVGWQGATTLPIETAFNLDATLIMRRQNVNGHDYWFTVQILDQAGNRIASNADGPILRWLYPTTQWRAEDRVPVSVNFDVPALAPGAYQLVVGVYPQFGDVLPATTAAGETIANGLARIAWLKVPQKMPLHVPETAIHTEAVFENTFELVGIEARPANNGQTQVDLYWRLVAENTTYDASIFVHLLDENDTILAQNDTRPLNGQYPTFIWNKDEIVKTTHVLDAAPERLRLRVGMYFFPGPQNLMTEDGQAWVDIDINENKR
jgi:hypothetical protein